MANNLRRTTFDKVDLADPFFDSLKAQYGEFSDWFEKKAKAGEPVYVIDDTKPNQIRGFVYLKTETGPVTDTTPPLPPAKRLKVGTLKVNAAGTKLGERIIKLICDRAIRTDVDEAYVTVFDTHKSLLDLLARYGFSEIGKKTTTNGTELVLLKSFRKTTGDRVKDYPRLATASARKWLLAIYPEYHTKLLPDSILNTEDPNEIEDVAHTNTIHKVYISKISLKRMKPGDIVVFYRTSDKKGPAYFRSVATSICIIEEVRSSQELGSLDAFLKFSRKHSVFSDSELESMYNTNSRLYAARMLYNAALPKRPIRKVLLESVGITEQPRWDLRELSDKHFERILEISGVHKNLIID